MKSSLIPTRVLLLGLAAVFALLPWGDRPGPIGFGRVLAEEEIVMPKGASPQVVVETEDPSCLPKDPPPPVLKLKIRVPSFSTFEQTLVYKICIENISASEAHNVVVKHALPASVRLLRADPEPWKSEPEMQWSLGTIGAGAAREICLHLKPTMREDIKNCTRVQFEHGVCLTTRIADARVAGERDPRVMPVPGDGLPSEGPGATGRPPEFPGAGKEVIPPPPPVPGKGRPPIVEGFGEARLRLDVEGPERVRLNQQPRYFITLKNTGTKSATTVGLSATLDNVDFVSSSHKAVPLENIVAWSLPTIAPGAAERVELVVSGKKKGRFCVKFESIADLNVRADNIFCTEYLDASTLHMEISDQPGSIALGKQTTYKIKVLNQGLNKLTNIRMSAFVSKHLDVRRKEGPVEGDARDEDPVPAGRRIVFPIVAELASGKEIYYYIDAIGVAPGDARVQAEVRVDQLEVGVVTEQESTTIYEHK